MGPIAQVLRGWRWLGPLAVCTPDPEGEQVAMEGLDPNKVSLRSLRRAQRMWSNGEIRGREVPAVAERLTIEENETLLGRQEAMDLIERDLPE